MRCFLAIDIEENLKPRILAVQQEMKGWDAKLVEPQNMHFTLKFLGNIDDRLIEDIKSRMKRLTAETKPFKIRVKGAGVFPNINYVRVVWVGAVELLPLQKILVESMEDLFGKERDLTSHLTLARIRSARDNEKIKEFLEKHKGTEIGSMHVKEIKLKKSVVTNKGPTYSDIEVFRLGK